MRGFLVAVSLMSVVACGSDSAPDPKEAAVPAVAEKAPPVQNCTYTLTEAKPGWTAYKTTDKAPVSGTFTSATLSPTKAGPSIAAGGSGRRSRNSLGRILQA